MFIGRYAIVKTISNQEKYRNSDIFLNLLEYLIASIGVIVINNIFINNKI